MIPLWKEIAIREEISKSPDASNRDLATMFKIDWRTVATIRKLPGLRKRQPPKSQRKLKVPKRCNKCGALLEIWPCVLCWPWAYYYDDVTLEIDV